VPTSSRQRRVSLRQLALFVLAMVVPSIVLVALGVRIIVQQEELAEKHVADQRRLGANEFERALEARLERLRQDPGDRSVAVVASVDGDHLMLPWDMGRRTNPADESPFSAAIQRAEREEFGAGRLAAAETQLRAAAALARTDQQKAYARLLVARVLAKANRPADADREYRRLLAVPLPIADEDGVPFALYGADRLVNANRAAANDRAAVARIVDAAATELPRMAPAAWYLARRVDDWLQTSDGSASEARRARITRAIADGEHALALQRDYPILAAQWKLSEAAWIAHGSPLWLVGATAVRPSQASGAIAVRADELVLSLPLAFRSARLASATASGDLVGEAFPGLKVDLSSVPTDSQTPSTFQRGFYVTALAVVLSVTLFGGYMLWRDVDREIRVATLRSQFVSSVSHELKTPLTAIRMFAETLQLDRVDARTRTEYLDTIVNESERLTRLLNNVLDFSKIEEGRKTYRPEAASLGEVVRVAARAMAYPLEQHGFVLGIEIDDSLPPLAVDSDALEQAILNLLTNAMKYSGVGRTIDLRLARDADRAIISVHDRGIGIPTADQDRIFEKFYRVATPENQRIPGTGLGLTLVDHIVKGHNGSVHVESAPGRGSVFSIYLPLRAADAPAAVIEATS